MCDACTCGQDPEPAPTRSTTCAISRPILSTPPGTCGTMRASEQGHEQRAEDERACNDRRRADAAAHHGASRRAGRPGRACRRPVLPCPLSRALDIGARGSGRAGFCRRRDGRAAGGLRCRPAGSRRSGRCAPPCRALGGAGRRARRLAACRVPSRPPAFPARRRMRTQRTAPRTLDAKAPRHLINAGTVYLIRHSAAWLGILASARYNGARRRGDSA